MKLETDWPLNWFEEFWNKYPRRIAKKDAARALDKVRRSGEVEFQALLKAVENFARSVKGKDPQYIPHPATWINGGRWDDELGPPSVDNGSWRIERAVQETMARRRMQ